MPNKDAIKAEAQRGQRMLFEHSRYLEDQYRDWKARRTLFPSTVLGGRQCVSPLGGTAAWPWGQRRKETEMAIYKLTSSIVVNSANGTVLVAGQTVTDTGPGAQLPPGYIPNGCCDPRDADGVNKFWAAGPIQPTMIYSPRHRRLGGSQWSAPGNPNRLYKLTGALAASLPAVLGYS